jgi:HSP20 family protein
MRRDPKTWMWAEAIALLERAEGLHRQFFHLALSPARRPTWQPPIDMFETEHGLSIVAALPGVPPTEIEISADGGDIVIAGNRPLPGAMRGAEIQRLELPHGRFERRIELPPGHFEFDRQELVNGCLTLYLRKA